MNSRAPWGAHNLGGSPRFEVIYVPVPQGGYCVRDNMALPIRLHAGGRLYNRYERHQPHSSYYETMAEAGAIADWLAQRSAGYPFCLLLAEHI